MTDIKVTLDLSRYTVQQLNDLYLQGILSKEEYDEEMDRRELDNGTDKD